MKSIDLNAMPAPLTPVDCDLRDFAFMPLDVVRLRDSDLAVTAEADEFRCAVLLWCASWHQVPAASLPDDDKILAQYAGYGRVVKEWMKVRTGALRGWVKCADGRLYHPVVAEKAGEAWTAKLRQRLKTECGRIKKHNERHPGANIPFPEFDAWLAAGCPTGQPLFVPDDKAGMSQGQGNVVPSDKLPMSPGQGGSVTGENHSKGQGEGQGQGQLNSKPESSSQASTGVGAGEQLDDDDRAVRIQRSTSIATLLSENGIEGTIDHAIVRSWAADPRMNRELLTDAITKARKSNSKRPMPLAYLEATVLTLLEKQATPPRAAAPAAAPILAPVQRKPQGDEPKGPDESYEDWRARVDAFERAKRNGGKAA
jgi:hypothetical protein